MNKALTVVAFVVLAALAVGAYFYPGTSQNLGNSSPGTNFNTEKQAAVAISLATPGAGATSTSILNTDAGSRYISSFKVGCSNVGTSQTAYTGTGLSSLQLTIATTATANPATIPVGFADVANAFALGTGTVNLLVASSTLTTATSSLAAIWHAGENLTFWFNATNTAACTIGVSYFQS